MTLSRLLPRRQRPPIVIEIDVKAMDADFEEGAIAAAKRQSDRRVVPRVVVCEIAEMRK